LNDGVIFLKTACEHLSFSCYRQEIKTPILVFHLSRKQFNAVERNRIKRITREFVRRRPVFYWIKTKIFVLKKFNPYKDNFIQPEMTALQTALNHTTKGNSC